MPTTIELQRRRFEFMASEHAILIGARIREARLAMKLTQHELSDKIPGKSDGTQVSKWERGEHRVSDDTLKHIARILKRDVAWFHAREPSKAETPDPFAGGQLATIETKLEAIDERLNHIDAALTILFSGHVLVAGTRRDIERVRRQLGGGNVSLGA